MGRCIKVSNSKVINVMACVYGNPSYCSQLCVTGDGNNAQVSPGWTQNSDGTFTSPDKQTTTLAITIGVGIGVKV